MPDSNEITTTESKVDSTILLWAVSDDSEQWYGPHPTVEACVAQANDPSYHDSDYGDDWVPEYIYVAPGEEWWPYFSAEGILESCMEDECPVEDHPAMEDGKFSSDFQWRIEQAFKDSCLACGIPKVYSVDSAQAQKVALPSSTQDGSSTTAEYPSSNPAPISAPQEKETSNTLSLNSELES